jgi:hypothetical protein
MVCAIQYMESKGNAHIRAGYVVNDGTHTVFVNTGTKDNTIPLYIYLGIGDTNRGKAVYDAAFIMPDVSLNGAQFNSLIASMPHDDMATFKG